MALPPLTHHEILGLVEPFSRSGRRVDLGASDRLERRVVFKRVEHKENDATPALHEDLELASPYAGTFRLTRVLRSEDGLSARLVAEGSEPGALLALVESVPIASQRKRGVGFALALSHTLGSGGLILTDGVARVAGLTLTLTISTVRRLPADITLTAGQGDTIALPEDLLAVLGWDWAPLKRVSGEWRSKLRLRGRGPERSRRTEEKLERAAHHLAETIAAPPRRFHERFARARWGAAVRRTIPILSAVAVTAVAVLVPVKLVDANPWLRLAMMNLPLLVIGLSFTLQEQARLELPPLPRPSVAATWRPSPEERG